MRDVGEDECGSAIVSHSSNGLTWRQQGHRLLAASSRPVVRCGHMCFHASIARYSGRHLLMPGQGVRGWARWLAACADAQMPGCACRGWGYDRAAAALVGSSAPAAGGSSMRPAVARSAPAVLQDMAVVVADAVAAAYLAEAGAGPGEGICPAPEIHMPWPGVTGILLQLCGALDPHKPHSACGRKRRMARGSLLLIGHGVVPQACQSQRAARSRARAPGRCSCTRAWPPRARSSASATRFLRLSQAVCDGQATCARPTRLLSWVGFCTCQGLHCMLLLPSRSLLNCS